MSEQKFHYILDVVPDWWKATEGIQIDIPTTIACLPNGQTAAPGDWIIRESDGTLRTELNREGRIEARQYLANLRKEVAL